MEPIKAPVPRGDSPMRARNLRMTLLIAMLALTPTLASARPWNESFGRPAAAGEARGSGSRSLWRNLVDRIIAIWANDGGVSIPGG